MTRRTFLQASIAAAAATAVPTSVTAQRKLGPLGLQLYSVRDLLKQDFAGTLQKIAAIGFKEVEFAGLFGLAPADVKALLDKNGLTTPASHVDWGTAENKLPEAIATAKALGQQYLIVPYVGEAERKQPDIWKHAADLFNKVGKETQKAGIQFAYHQHSFEFVPSADLGGKMPYDYLLENTDPAAVKMELDICWTVAAEQDPVAYFNRYPGRFPLIHVKDWLKDGKDASAYAGAARRPDGQLYLLEELELLSAPRCRTSGPPARPSSACSAHPA